MKRLFIPCLALTAFSLFACGQHSYEGVYSFQLGRDKGVHAKAAMELTSIPTYADSDSTTPALGNQFRFTFEFQERTDPTSSSDSSSSASSSQASTEGSSSGESSSSSPDVDGMDISALIRLAYDLFGDGQAIVGYYHVELGNQLKLGIMLDDAAKTIIATAMGVPAEGFTITPEMTEKIMYSTISDKDITLAIPVSTMDLLYQVYWYGYDIHFEDGSFHFDELPTPHEPGTHPTAADVAAINADPTYQAHHPSAEFRDYFTVTLALGKE